MSTESGSPGFPIRAIPLRQTGDAGPWRMNVLRVLRGDDAKGLVAGASSFNLPPRRDAEYLLVQLRAVNAGNRSFDLETADFGVVGRSGLVDRYCEATPPSPTLDATSRPGESLDGWAVFEIPASETQLALLYDSVSISGRWARQYFALESEAALPGATTATSPINGAGASFGAPATQGELIATASWTVTLLETTVGSAVVDLFPTDDLRTWNLAANDEFLASWVALNVRITNNRIGTGPSFLPATAFAPVDDTGGRLESVGFLTPPAPDFSGDWFPGAVRESWVIVRPKDGGTIGPVIRFQPFWTDEDPRYLMWNPTGATTDAGAAVTVGLDVANLRKGPSTDSGIVETLQPGTPLTVTGAPISGGAHTWWPVTNPATGDSGYVAADVLSTTQP